MTFPHRTFRPGMTLIEMVVAIGVFSIIMVGVTLLFAMLWRLQGHALRLGTASQQAQQALVRVTDAIRNARQADSGAFPVVAVSDNEIILYGDADADAATERLRFWRDGSVIRMGVIQPVATLPVTYPTDQETTSVIATAIVDNPSGMPLLAYYDGTNAPLTTPAAAAVRMVRIALAVDENVNASPAAVEVSSFASLRNLREW